MSEGAERQLWAKVFSRKSLGVIALAFVVLSVGFVAGRFGNTNTIRAVRNQWFRAPKDPAAEAGRSRTAAEMNALLNNRLEEQHRLSSRWNPLLQTTDRDQQRAIVEKLRFELHQLVSPWPGPQTDLNPQKEPWFHRDGVEVSLVRIQTHPDVHLLNILLVPDNVTGPGPALMVLHGSSGTRDKLVNDIDYHHGFAFALARKGFIVLAPLMVAWTMETHETFLIKAMASGWNYDAIESWQFVRGIDYLRSLPQVDRGHIGVYGISRGGFRALLLGAVDPRISLVLTSGHFTNRFAWLFRQKTYPYVRPENRMLDVIEPEAVPLFAPSMSFLFDQMNLVALIQPRFFGVESGTRDRRHLGASVEFKKVTDLYEHVGHPERTAFMPFNGVHEVSVENVTPFLKKWVDSPAIPVEEDRARKP